MIVGVIATHDEYPVERIKLDRRSKWLGSVSHDECLKLTDVEDLFEESDDEDGEEEQEEEEEGEDGEDVDMSDSDAEPKAGQKKSKKGAMGDFGRSTQTNDDFFADL